MVDSSLRGNQPFVNERTWVEGPERLGNPRAAIAAADAETVREAWSAVPDSATGNAATRALIDELQGQVTQATIYALRAQLLSTTPSPLLHHARTEDARVILTFAGQAQTYFDDLERLYEIPSARRVIQVCAEALTDEVNGGAALKGLHPYGLHLIDWIENPEARPPESALADAVISQPLIFVAQAAQLVALERFGFSTERIGEWAVATTGHSQGILAALLASEALALEPLAERAAQISRYLIWQGIHMQTSYGRAPGSEKPMVAVTGQTREEVEAALEGAEAVIGLSNAPRRFVISGQPDSLKIVVERLEARSKAEHSAFDRGLCARPRPLGIEWLGVSAPYHSPAMANALAPMQETFARLGINPDPSVLAVPMIRFEDGAVWSGEDLCASQSINPVLWPETMRGCLAFEPTHLLDAGPGAGVSAVSALCLRGRGVQVIAAATEQGEETLMSREPEALNPPLSWSVYAPITVERPDGSIVLENEFTRRTNRQPILLPGMTPTTVESPIVANAANAGFMAELAGGGQVTEAIFRQRAQELRTLLNPGEGYVVNTLYLDPYLWGLQVGKDRVIQKLRAEGHPILGVTITAGIPPLEEAVDLLKNFRELGMDLNSLKVGNDDQIRQVLAIADADEGSFIIQVEGGKAGGHHSFDGLHELLLTWYARIRRRENLLLTVGGGVGTAEQVRELLTGEWSTKYGRAPMPVDAVFLGTALMAAEEACTSPQVKEVLVQTKGTEEVVGRGRSVGGVRSGLSGLGADIHYVDNHAARTSALLDSMAGDAETIEANRDGLIAALNKTAKPYFGDIEGMTYGEALGRLIEVMALGRDEAYQDGVWLDVTHRMRYGRMLRRSLQRCAYQGALPADDTLNAPNKQLRSLIDACPALAATPVLPEDVRFFITKVCATPGKPVPFVPVIDENVRRWYCSDSLWQAHDDRYAPDQVLIIPGPEAVAGITEANVPIADLLSGYLQRTIESVPNAGQIATPDHVESALSAEVCLFGETEKTNPLPKILEVAGDAAELAPTKRGVQLTLTHQLPVRGHRELVLEFDVLPFHPFPLRARPNTVDRIRDLYQAVMPDEVSVDDERVSAYRRVTSDDGPATPEQLFFATGLPAMMQVLLEPKLGLDPLSLLHLRSEVQQLEAAPGPYTVRTDSTYVVDEPGGRRVAIKAEVCAGSKTVARLDQEFFIRSFSGKIPAEWSQDNSESSEETGPSETALDRPRHLFSISRRAPSDLRAFAHISGDLNPIHRDPALAALAGLPGPIVHGQWTAATACALLVGADRQLKHSEARFLAPVMPGAELEFNAEVVARIGGDEVVEVEVLCEGTPALSLRARVAGQKTALVFPGQGSQRRGMGMPGYERSKAAKAVWDRADTHTIAKYGFSLLDIVRNNPKTVDIGAEIVRHPDGVLNVTQFTQVALTVLSVAGVAELREAGACADDCWFGGHSVGEYSALSAVTHVLPLEALIDVVYHRGLTMQRFVPRDEMGRSDYAMGVIRPNRAKMDGQTATDLVERVAHETGQPIYVVNHNVLNRQYAVAGHLEAIAELEGRLLKHAADGSAWVRIPGIDVPFHSPLLVDGVPAFRAVLENCISKEIDIDRLVGRYVPNLVARPFELTEDFVDAMIEATGYRELTKIRKKPAKHGRKILIELLAWQFASPVRWIETQEYFADTVEQLVEIGPASAPVLTNMFLSSTRHRDHIPDVLHSGRDFDAVIGVGAEAAPEPEAAPSAEVVSEMSAPAASAPAPVAVAAGPVEALDDADWSVGASLKALLALRVGVGLNDIGGGDTVDGLLGGNSARRNQVLLDLGKEFGAGAVDGAHELPISELTEALERASGSRYRHPGPILKAAQTQALGTVGLPRKAALATLKDAFGLGSGRSEAVLSTLAVETSAYQGASDPVKAAAKAYAAREGISLERAVSAGAATVSVDAGALEAAQQEMKGHWLEVARSALTAGGLDPLLVDQAMAEPEPAVSRQETVQGGRFNADKHVAFTAVHQWARADVLRWYWDLRRDAAGPEMVDRIARRASDDTIEMLNYLGTTVSPRTNVGKAIKACRVAAEKGMKADLPWSGQTALITGSGPDSIAESVVRRLLEGGARVVVTTSRPSRPRLARFKSLYRAHAARGAELHVVPFDQGNFEDIDGLCEWLLASRFETRGANRFELKGPWLPTLCFPFGAVPAEGDLTTLDADIAATLQVNLIGVQRLIGKLATEIGKRGEAAEQVHIVLPLSPNHGQMGRDGLYAESKIGLETLLRRWEAEYDRWGRYTTLCGAKIGWVRGTGLMHGLDRVYQTVESELGIETYSPMQMADALLDQCSSKARAKAAKAPQVADLTGGFGKAKGLRDLINVALRKAQAGLPTEETKEVDPGLPLNLFEFPKLPEGTQGKGIDPADCVAIVGFGEVGPYGNSRIRWDAEKNQTLSREAALELAWLCGKIKFEGAEWIDVESGDPVDVNTLYETYELAEKIGVRVNQVFDPDLVEAFTEVILSEDMSFNVPDADLAETFRLQDPEHTVVIPEADGCRVIRKAGARVRVPRVSPIDRDIAGQLPEGFEPTRLGFDSQQLEQIDPVGIFNLLATAEAFRSAGLEPEDLWQAVHPSRIACTQGSGIGGMRALRRLYADSVLDQNKQGDVLQETLINVGAAYPGMYLYGGYGSMINPVSACATAAVSVEIGTDILRSGKADFVVAGAFDDFSKEGARGFAEMQATISKVDRTTKGLDPNQSSRPCDSRRGGFVEAQGGGTVLMCRGDKAIELGLPIYGLIVGAWSCADGLQRSVPAPGPGVAAIAAGGAASPLGQALDKLGLKADDIGVVSMHGTSTDANDLNETKLHARLATALGRTTGNPLPVIGQKALTGHAKGGAAAWQIIGLLQALGEGVVPPMHNLEEPDRRLDDRAPLVFPDEAIQYPEGELRAGILTSLGFGHVGAAVCVAHPDVLLGTLKPKALSTYETKRNERWRHQLNAQYGVLMGDAPYFEGRMDKPISAEEEYAMLLDPDGRV